jgi:hypothetical protein
LTKNNMTVVPHPFYFSIFSHMRIKLKGHHFDTSEVITDGAEHNFQNN